ncbi:MAG: DNA topoisomerase IV subunit B [Fimbriimonadaceae bacterium]|nr:DNA topoisomerase IV subunit B [Fimbriimonadaceae bacterium]
MADKDQDLTPESTEETADLVTTEALELGSDGRYIVEGDYDANQIQVLEGLEAVRKRPGMYVGDNGKKGLHQMFREVLDNSVDEALAGHCDFIQVKLHADNSMSVEDNGRGIPVDKHAKMGVSALQVVMTVLHAGGKFGEGGGYKTSGGLHGVGVSCTNALSAWMETTVKRNGKLYRQRYEMGRPVTEVEVIGKSQGTGTLQHWMADDTVLTESKYDTHILKNRLRELAYLNPQVKFDFKNEQNPDDDEEFFYQRGIPQLVEDVNEAKNSLHPVIFFKRRKDTTELEVALQYHDGYTQTVLAFSNNIHQPDGGTHVSGFSQALTRVINAYARKGNYLKEKDTNFTSDDISDGLTAVISLRLENPQYNSQDKVKLVTPEVQGMVNSLVGDGLNTYMEENPAIARRIVEKAVIAQRMREAAKKAAEAVKRSSAMDSFGLPGKLSDCVSKDPQKCEIFLVEGDSAGGSAKGARDRVTQAILPLRGKILNVEKARVDKALDNEEIKSLIAALGVGIDLDFGRGEEDEQETLFSESNVEENDKVRSEVANGAEPNNDYTEIIVGADEEEESDSTEADDLEESDEAVTVEGDDVSEEVVSSEEAAEAPANGRKRSSTSAMKSATIGKGQKDQREKQFDLSKLRYHKIIIMTDADVDGEHIRTLLLTFFYRYMRPIIEKGYLYLAQPPLFVIKVGNNERHYAMTEKERDEIVRGLGKKRNCTIQRFKGLGEMNADELEETTMNPEHRTLVKVNYDTQFMMDVERLFSDLMGEKVEPRRAFIEKHAKQASDVDWHY